MASYIQVNIYNETIEALKEKGIDLDAILKNAGCSDTCITEIPIRTPPKPAPIPDNARDLARLIPPISSTMEVAPPEEEQSQKDEETTLKPFKSISTEIHSVQPLVLANVLKIGENLFDEWDPLLNLPPPPLAQPPQQSQPSTSSTSESLPEEGLKVPKQEIIEEEDEEVDEKNDSTFEMNLEEMRIIQDFLTQNVNNLENGMATPSSVANGSGTGSTNRRKMMSVDPEIANTVYLITCSYPNCTHQYNWRVKYGKLRLLDHALSHSDRKIPCKICGFETSNVRRMRSHYAKMHPTERVQGYGMKALVNGSSSENEHCNDDEIRKLWHQCYAPWIYLVGDAGMSEGDKFKRGKKRRAGED